MLAHWPEPPAKSILRLRAGGLEGPQGSLIAVRIASLLASPRSPFSGRDGRAGAAASGCRIAEAAVPVLAVGCFAGHLGGGRGEQPGLPLGLGGERAGGAFRAEVQDRPELTEPVEGEQAQRMAVPAGRQRGGEVAVAGLVDLLDPRAEPVDRCSRSGSRQLPPARCRLGPVGQGVRSGVGAEAGDVPGKAGDLLVEPAEGVDHGGVTAEDGGHRLDARTGAVGVLAQRP